jgi:hypothetical protein
LGIIRRRDIAFRAKDWNGRDILLLKSTLTQHVARFHFDELLVIDELRRRLPNPLVVIENPGAGSEQAIYDIPVGGHAYLLVAVKYRRWLGKGLIVTLYGTDQIPEGRQLWRRK